MARTVSEILAARRQRAFQARDERLEALERQYPDFKALQEQKQLLGRRLLMAGLGRSEEDPEELRKEIQANEEQIEAWKKKAGLSEAYFQPDFTCPDCQDQGFVHGQSCHCRKQLLIEEHYDMSAMRDLLQRENFQTARMDLFRKDRQEGEFLSPYDNMKELYQTMQSEYVEGFTVSSPNLYFYGPVGTGKTFLLSSIAKAVLDRGFTVLYQTAPDLIDFMVQYSFMYPSDRREEEENRRSYIFSCDLLVIDDLGTERINDQTVSALFEVINGRLISARPVILSSNLELDELGDIYDERIASRIQGEYAAFRFFGGDLRRRK